MSKEVILDGKYSIQLSANDIQTILELLNIKLDLTRYYIVQQSILKQAGEQNEAREKYLAKIKEQEDEKIRVTAKNLSNKIK